MAQAEIPLGARGGPAADLARFDGLLAELRREHENVARQLRDHAHAAAPVLRAAAGQADEALGRPAPGVAAHGQLEVQTELRDAGEPPGSVPPWSEPAWGGNSPTKGASGVGVAIRDPATASASSGRGPALSDDSTPSGDGSKSMAKSFTRSLSRSFGNPLEKGRQTVKSLITAHDEVFDNRRLSQDSADHARTSSFCYIFVNSPTFELLWSTVILLNTLTMALEAQYDGIDGSYRYDLGRSPSTQPASKVWPGADTFFVVTDTMFGALFTLELLWRLAILRKELFLDTWSWIDIIAVGMWYIERLSESILPLDPKFIRVARLVKLLRFIRVIRFINAFEKLYLMVASIKSSFSALAWSSAVLLLVEMVFALLLNILMEGFWDNVDNPLEDRQAIYEHFGTFSKSLLSMFEMLLGNWYTITRELVKVDELYMILGVGHQLCFGFAVIEVMTGVFLHETFQVASLDDGIMTNETKRAIKNNTEKMKIFFENADVNGDGYLDKDELEGVLKRHKVQEWLTGMGLDIPDVVTAFSVMDKDGDGQLSTQEFVEGALFLKGNARMIELAVIRGLLEEIKSKVSGARPLEERAEVARPQ
ncbi:unnamed protein product [Prorocentrum cordatum]|uniref:EF-hand domain-containing protein n=1 Tax=Prorocentrum cordatum TaxID=2364126 RepID=A0ABN9Q346_9DINO|nr:unnamed protein product [Polarella glacialis]